jgi:SNF2 family DNA or RNA helicase
MAINEMRANLLHRSMKDPTPSAKLEELASILKNILEEDEKVEVGNRRKVLVFCAWPSLWPVLQSFLLSRDIPVMLIQDNVGKRRDNQIAEFQQEEPHVVDDMESYVAIISSTVSTGVNLTRASVIIMLVSQMNQH